MSIRPCNPGKYAMSQSNRQVSRHVFGAVVIAILAAAPLAHALSSDHAKPMNVTAGHSKITQGGEKEPGVANLEGRVQITHDTKRADGARGAVAGVVGGRPTHRAPA